MSEAKLQDVAQKFKIKVTGRPVGEVLNSKYLLMSCVAVFATSALIFYRLIYGNGIAADFASHIIYAHNSTFDGEPWPRHFLYFILISASSFWTQNLEVWKFSAIIWLSFLVCAKFVASLWFINSRRFESGTTGREGLSILLALALLFVFTLPPVSGFDLGFWYRYSFPPNVWHNSTLITLMPFAIVTFVLGQRQLEGREGNLIWLILFALLSAFAKPSFLMAWLPVYSGFIIISTMDIRRKMMALIPVIVCGIVILAQYKLIYETGTSDAHVQIGWLTAWLSSASRSETDFFYSIACSLLFPMAFYVAYPGKLRTKLHQQAILMCLLSFFYAAFFSESAGGLASGNFMWTAISSVFLLQLICATDNFFFSDTTDTVWLERYFPTAIFMIQILFGFAYLGRYLVTGNYS